jgi:hypothetical protein
MSCLITFFLCSLCQSSADCEVRTVLEMSSRSDSWIARRAWSPVVYFIGRKIRELVKMKGKWKFKSNRVVSLHARSWGSTCYCNGSATILRVSFHASASYKKKSISERREKEMRQELAHSHLTCTWFVGIKNQIDSKDGSKVKRLNRKSCWFTGSIAVMDMLYLNGPATTFPVSFQKSIWCLQKVLSQKKMQAFDAYKKVLSWKKMQASNAYKKYIRGKRRGLLAKTAKGC